MKVSVIMPTGGRWDSIYKTIHQFMIQDYPEKELILSVEHREFTDFADCLYTLIDIYGEREVDKKIKRVVGEIGIKESVGVKRNLACEDASGEVILHFDDDDYYAPDWISKSVEALINSKADCVGLSSGYFYQIPDKVLRYDYPKGCQPYVLGATMCYWRKTWERNQFKDTNRGEDTLFCANAGKVVAHDHINSFMAMLHGGNTSSHLQIDKKEFTPQDISIAKNILGADFEKYVSLLCKSS